MLLALSSGAAAQDLASLASDTARASELVVTGRVTRVEARWDAGAIYEYVTVQVTGRLKGAETPASIVIKQLGGRVGTRGLFIQGQASFVLGEDVLLFLAIRPRDGTLYTTGLERGKWRLLPDLAGGPPRAIPVAGTGGGQLAGIAAGSGLALDEVARLAAATPLSGRPFVAVPQETSLAGPAYTYLPTQGGPPARWHQVDESVAIEVGFQANAAGVPGGETELLNAMAKWNAGGTRLRLQHRGSGDVVPPCDYSDTDDGFIRVYFDDPCNDFDDGDPAFFGVGGGYYTTGDQRTIGGVDFQKFTAGYVVLNNTGPHLASAACFQDALTHTLGHAIGLGDSTASGSIMRTTLPCTRAGLGQDDVNGLVSIYPAIPSGPNPPAAPTAFSGTVSLNQVNLQWTPATSGGPVDSYIVEAGNGTGLANVALMPVSAPATSLVVTNVPSGSYYVRVKARNIIATSGPSPEIVVNVGPCEAPGTPQGFTASTNDIFANLAWNPPASGGTVQGYTLAVGSEPGQADLLVQPLGPTTTLAATANYGTYYARLFATNSCGASQPTPDIVVQLQACSAPPNAPSGLAFVKNGSAQNQVSFSWTPPASGPAPTRYVVVVRSPASNGPVVLVQPTPNAQPSFAAVGPSGTYFVRVFAQNACGNSADSNEVQVVIP